MKKLIILFLFIFLLFGCSREAAGKLKCAVDDYYDSSITALSQVKAVYLQLAPVDENGNVDKNLKYEVTNHFDKIAAAYKSYKDIFGRLETGYYLAAPTVKKTKTVLEKLIRQQAYFYQLFDLAESDSDVSDIDEGFLSNEKISETRLSLYTAIIKGALVWDLIENYNNFDASILGNVISDYNDKLNNPDFNENINIIVNKIGGN